MTWAGTNASGLFWTINVGGGFQSVDWEPPRGDVSGVIDSLIVIGLQGQSVSSSVPLFGDILTFDGSQWVPSSSGTTTAHNLLSATHPDTVPASPTDGDIIAGSGAAWVRFPVGQARQVLTATSGGNIVWADKHPTEVITSGTLIVLNESNERVVIAKTVGSETTVSMPTSPYFGQEILIKDGKGDANTNQIIVDPSPTTIDGFSAIRLTQNYQAFSFLYNGTEWNII
jgi:hypothetical protein